ncbi:MAG: hypothetical protein ABJE99_00960 [Roseobacter sp.]
MTHTRSEKDTMHRKQDVEGKSKHRLLWDKQNGMTAVNPDSFVV